MHHKTIAELAKGLTKADYSSVELTKYFLARIQQYDSRLNSFITLTEEQALAQAKQADTLRAKGQAQTLTGIPIAHKDIFCTQDVKTTCGSRMLDNFIAPYNATMVEQMRQNGLVMLGKTNMDEFAMGSSNETSYYGAVKNPWDTSRIPGGSSGGSAAAVAARLVPATTGSDTGGSIRQPAALCGVTGLKPTYGRISRFGMIAFASSLDQAGIFTQTAEDAALLLGNMAGFDSKDSTSIDQPVPDYTLELNEPLTGLNIGLPKEFFTDQLDPAIGDCIMQAAKQYEALGANLHEVSLPNINLAIPVYYVVAPAEASSNLSRYDGVRFGYRCHDPKDLEDLYKRSRSEAFGIEVQRRILIGTHVLSAGYYDAYYLKAQKVRRIIADEFQQAFKQVDVLLGPTSPDVAFKINDKIDDPISMYLSDIYTAAVNLAGLPGISIPAGFHQKLPIGLQFIGNHFSEGQLLNVAHQYQQHTTWHQQLPEEFK